MTLVIPVSKSGSWLWSLATRVRPYLATRWHSRSMSEALSACEGWAPRVQARSPTRLFATPRTAAHQASLSISTSQSVLKLMSTESVMPSTISSSVVPFSSRLQSFPASGSFPMIGSSHQVATILELQHQSFQGIFRVDFLPLIAAGGIH